jgi:hypothetical protein
MRESIGGRVRAFSPVTILAIGWVGILLYGFPGHMSYDSVGQLLEARAGVYTDGHPPAMAVLWRVVETVIAGPLGMLLIQTACFLAGAYLLFKQRMSPRAAAVTATMLLWFPPVSNAMSTIWKDSQMTGFLMLGTGLLVTAGRRAQLWGLAAVLVATMMRHNAFAMTFPIIGLLFVWNPAHRWWKRYAIAIAAWFAVTLSAQMITRALTDEQRFIWHQSLALLDMVGTLRNVPDMTDAELSDLFDGIALRKSEGLHDAIRATHDPAWTPVDNLWHATDSFFVRPRTADERAAVARAWRATVPSHLGAYLAYRWVVFRQLVQLTDVPLGSPAYIWFTDIQDLYGSAAQIGHNAHPSGAQIALHEAMMAFGSTFMFHVYFYIFLALALVPFCLRDREALALVASALTSEAALFVLTPTTDFRYSFWLLLGTVVALILAIARRRQIA